MLLVPSANCSAHCLAITSRADGPPALTTPSNRGPVALASIVVVGDETFAGHPTAIRRRASGMMKRWGKPTTNHASRGTH